MPPVSKCCARCGQTHPASAFGRNRRRRDGLQTYCRSCMAAVRRDWYERRGATQRARNDGYKVRNARYLWSYLLVHPCVDCGETDPIVLEFDHVRGEKVGSLSNMAIRQFSVAKLAAEVATCEVRCANCHKRKTAREQGWHAWLDGTA